MVVSKVHLARTDGLTIAGDRMDGPTGRAAAQRLRGIVAGLLDRFVQVPSEDAYRELCAVRLCSEVDVLLQ